MREMRALAGSRAGARAFGGRFMSWQPSKVDQKRKPWGVGKANNEGPHARAALRPERGARARRGVSVSRRGLAARRPARPRAPRGAARRGARARSRALRLRARAGNRAWRRAAGGSGSFRAASRPGNAEVQRGTRSGGACKIQQARSHGARGRACGAPGPGPAPRARSGAGGGARRATDPGPRGARARAARPRAPRAWGAPLHSEVQPGSSVAGGLRGRSAGRQGVGCASPNRGTRAGGRGARASSRLGGGARPAKERRRRRVGCRGAWVLRPEPRTPGARPGRGPAPARPRSRAGGRPATHCCPQRLRKQPGRAGAARRGAARAARRGLCGAPAGRRPRRRQGCVVGRPRRGRGRVRVFEPPRGGHGFGPPPLAVEVPQAGGVLEGPRAASSGAPAGRSRAGRRRATPPGARRRRASDITG